MLHDLFDRAVAIPLWIFQQFTKLVVRESLPDHRRCWRGQMPIGRSGRHMQAHQVVVLVTGTAFDRVDPFAIGPPPNLHRVAMAVTPDEDSLPRSGSSCIGGDGVQAQRTQRTQPQHRPVAPLRD